MQCKVCNGTDFVSVGAGMYQCQSCQSIKEPKFENKKTPDIFEIIFALADNNIKGLAIVGACLVVCIQLLITAFKMIVGMNVSYAIIDFIGLVSAITIFVWFGYELGKRKL